MWALVQPWVTVAQQNPVECGRHYVPTLVVVSFKMKMCINAKQRGVYMSYCGWLCFCKHRSEISTVCAMLRV